MLASKEAKKISPEKLGNSGDRFDSMVADEEKPEEQTAKVKANKAVNKNLGIGSEHEYGSGCDDDPKLKMAPVPKDKKKDDSDDELKDIKYKRAPTASKTPNENKASKFKAVSKKKKQSGFEKGPPKSKKTVSTLKKNGWYRSPPDNDDLDASDAGPAMERSGPCSLLYKVVKMTRGGSSPYWSQDGRPAGRFMSVKTKH